MKVGDTWNVVEGNGYEARPFCASVSVCMYMCMYDDDDALTAANAATSPSWRHACISVAHQLPIYHTF